MRIALISRRYPPLIGGAEKVLSYLAKALAEAGAEVSVLTCRPFDHSGPKVEPQPVSNPNGSLEIVRLPTSHLRFVGTWIYMRALRRWLYENRLDVAYVSMLKHDAYAAVKGARRRPYLVVLRPEGAGATGDIAWQSWGRFGSSIAEVCKKADAIVSISDAVTAELIGAGYDPGKIEALPNGVPIPETPWTLREGWRDAPRACYVGRLAPEKGLDTLVDAWPRVIAVFPKARLTLVGEGPERPGLEARIKALGLEGSIELPGASSEPANILRHSDLFVLPSREEGMSIALLEAMALGIPLVATAIPGNIRLIPNNETGRLAEPDDPLDIAQAIIDQWTDFDAAQAMARTARRRVIDTYSIEAVARRHLEMFKELSDRKKKARNHSAEFSEA